LHALLLLEHRRVIDVKEAEFSGTVIDDAGATRDSFSIPISP
jgi:hypothetical protein